MSLALRLGRTLSELRSTLTASELMMWAEFDKHSPVSDVRGDIQSAQLVSAIYGAQGSKCSLDDVLLRWGEHESDERSADPFSKLEAALLVASQ